MTHEEINKAVALELGWSVSKRGWWSKSGYRTEAFAPDFCSDHSAAAIMMNEIKEDERVRFMSRLWYQLPLATTFDLVNASPYVKSVAFLQIRNLWKG